MYIDSIILSFCHSINQSIYLAICPAINPSIYPSFGNKDSKYEQMTAYIYMSPYIYTHAYTHIIRFSAKRVRTTFILVSVGTMLFGSVQSVCVEIVQRRTRA